VLCGCVPALFRAFSFDYYIFQLLPRAPSRSYLIVGCVTGPPVLSETMAEVVAVDGPPKSRAIQRRKFGEEQDISLLNPTRTVTIRPARTMSAIVARDRRRPVSIGCIALWLPARAFLVVGPSTSVLL
jgi:hypothetical protein